MGVFMIQGYRFLNKEEFCFSWHGANIKDFAPFLLFKPLYLAFSNLLDSSVKSTL